MELQSHKILLEICQLIVSLFKKLTTFSGIYELTLNLLIFITIISSNFSKFDIKVHTISRGIFIYKGKKKKNHDCIQNNKIKRRKIVKKEQSFYL